MRRYADIEKWKQDLIAENLTLKAQVDALTFALDRANVELVALRKAEPVTVATTGNLPIEARLESGVGK